MSVSEISKKWTMPVRDRGLAYAQFIIFLRTDSQLRETIRGSGLLVNPSVTSCVRRSRRIDTSPPLGETTRTPEFIRWKIPVKYGKQRTTPLLFTVYLVAASGCSPALPCFAALLVLLRFSGLFAFTQFFFFDPTNEVCQPKTYRGKHYSISSSAFLILTARYSLVGRSILKRPSKLPTFSTVMFHVSIMSTVYILLSSI